MSKFKAGDPVYYPQLGHNIYRLQPTTSNPYPVKIYLGDKLEESFTGDGKLCEHDKAATLFHATPENQKKLEQLHGIKLEDTSPKPTSKEIIKMRLEKGENHLPCWVSDVNLQPNADCIWVFITSYDDEELLPYIDDMGHSWLFATPFNPLTREPITELPT